MRLLGAVLAEQHDGLGARNTSAELLEMAAIPPRSNPTDVSAG
jgi:hypothetical protein